MKVKRIVTLQRILLGKLEVGDSFSVEFGSRVFIKTEGNQTNPDQLMIALDTTKYPPTKTTYTIEGIEEEDVWVSDDGKFYTFDPSTFDESEIETIFV